MFDKFFDKLFEFIGLFKFWRVIPIHKKGVRTRWGINPVVLNPGFHFVFPFEADHVETCIVKPEWVSTYAIHITTKDFKTISVAPTIKFTITDSISWLYGVNDAATNLHEVIRFCTSDILTDCDWNECMTKPIWTKIKNKIKDKTKDLGIEIEDFGLIDLTISRVIITSINNG
jgi:regulator of protease activity HflC (stomatin/prohibitin superfamily)